MLRFSLHCLWAFLCMLSLSGCVKPQQQLGIPTAEWRTMSLEQQKQATANYKKIKTTFAQMDRVDKTVYDGPSITVRLLKGTALMPPFDRRYGFEAVAFNVDPGPCRRVRLESLDTNDHVDMRLCYNGLRLSLDPSYYDLSKSEGTLHFYYNPLWKRGFTYRDINTSGYVRLEHASIQIKTSTPVSPMLSVSPAPAMAP